MTVQFDFTEVNRLAANLAAYPSTVAPTVRQAVEVTARKVKDSARDGASGIKGMAAVPSRIDYDLKGDSGSVWAEIGFRKEGAGQLGNFVEYGSRYFPARQPLSIALHEQEGDFVRGLGIALADSLGDAL